MPARDNQDERPATVAGQGLYGKSQMNIEIENNYVKYVVDSNGRNFHFIDKQRGRDYCVRERRLSFAHVTKAGRHYDASSVSYTNGLMEVQFQETGVSAVIRAIIHARYFVLEVMSVTGRDVEELVFADIQLALRGVLKEPFAACALALNLQTNVPEIPGPNSRLRAMCYSRFGFEGAKVALIGCPQNDLRQVMQEVVRAARDLPQSSIGGPWALDASISKGSYLFTKTNATENTVNDWIQLTKRFGFNQLNFHGGLSFRFGDCQPNLEMYPRGYASVKAVIDRLHAEGIVAGLHTYAFFIDKTCPWITPVPDPRLANDAAFTLSALLTPGATAIPVVEPTKDMSAVTGFFMRNSVTLQIDSELLTYTGVTREPPWTFTGCRRGAYGTLIATHASGAKVYHLKECFGLFVPDGDSTLFTEVAARTAEMFNECGFDMIYLDALDGEDILGGGEHGWHYGSKFVFELCKRLKKPALMEMSTFHHHLWCVRSRMGAWDHPARDYKMFIDMHCKQHEANKTMFMPGCLGWWLIQTWDGAQVAQTFPDDMEYMCCKCLGTDSCFSLEEGVDIDKFKTTPLVSRLAEIIQPYETLRLADVVPESIKARLRSPGNEFTLVQDRKANWRFRAIQYDKHKVEGTNDIGNTWAISNKFSKQPLQLRIEALLFAESYDGPNSITLVEPSEKSLPNHENAPAITSDLQTSSDQVKVGSASLRFTAANNGSSRQGAWARAGTVFAPPLDLGERQGMGVWIHGDGQGEVLNFQAKSFSHGDYATGEHYVTVDFTGWRYCELIEPEGKRFHDYQWPYGQWLFVNRIPVNYSRVEMFNIWYNNLPPNGRAECYISPIKALAIFNGKLINPKVTIGGKTLVFPADIESGCYLECRSISDCKLYGHQGQLIREVMPQGDVPVFEAGENQVKFACDVVGGVNARAYVTIISRGKLLNPGAAPRV